MKINRSAGEPQQPQRSAPKPAPAAREPQQRRAYDYEQDDLFEEPPVPQKPNKKRKKQRRGVPVGCIVLVLLLALAGVGLAKLLDLYGELDGRDTQGAEQTVTVEQGSSAAAIAAQLKEEGIIEYDWLFTQYVKYSGKGSGIQYGEFQLRPGMGYNEIIKAISVQQRRATVTVTFPEGSTAVAIAQKMQEAGLCEMQAFLDCANGLDGSDFSQYSFWSAIPDNGRLMKCEGYLFPDTYEFFKDDSVYNYVNTFYKEFDKKTAELAATLAEKNTTMDEVVILASFIQEEAGVPEEDPKVSACFHNRLESQDPLWSQHMLESNACSYLMYDYENNYLWNSPTAQYFGWPEQGAIPEEVLAAYDTYRISGLPAGPISCPGYAAIEAALNPDETFITEGYYFFVTGHPDTEVAGQYFYAKTASEHNVNVQKAGWA